MTSFFLPLFLLTSSLSSPPPHCQQVPSFQGLLCSEADSQENIKPLSLQLRLSDLQPSGVWSSGRRSNMEVPLSLGTLPPPQGTPRNGWVSVLPILSHSLENFFLGYIQPLLLFSVSW